MANGTAKYADKTTYVGDIKEGKPHGHGEMVQVGEIGGEDGTGGPIVRYSGQWLMGEKHGEGELERFVDRVTYKGQWDHDVRHGQGRQEVPKEMSQSYGYTSYEGGWSNDRRQGHGVMEFSVGEGEKEKFRYEGEFHMGFRQG